MNKIVIKQSGSDKFFVDGHGFTGTIETATAYTTVADAACALKCAAAMGIKAVQVPQHKSFAVGYIRASDLNADGSVKNNANNPSRRRFATIEEARIHGARFYVRKAKGSRVVGSAGHIGYYTIVTNDKVNAKVNPATGLTNQV